MLRIQISLEQQFEARLLECLGAFLSQRHYLDQFAFDLVVYQVRLPP